jgi:hypothetical protein
MEFDDPIIKAFLEPQIRDHGGHTPIDTGLWLLFGVPATDALDNAVARSLLAGVPFTHHAGPSEDEQWTVYYVDDANRAAAIHWLDDLTKTLAGAVRPVAPAHRALLEEIVESAKPHRVAQQLSELHAAGAIPAGVYHDPKLVRSLLDRLHQREPLFFSAFLTLLTHHLVDLVVLLKQLIAEDVALKNELVTAGLSRDPFLQTRQDAAAEIRNILVRYQIINPIDQQKNTALTNPYAVYLDVVTAGEEISAPIDGVVVTVPRPNFLTAIRAIRRNLYRGEPFSSFGTQVPWMTAEIAHPFRFIKQCVESHRELTPLDALYMLERAVAA